MQTKRSPTASTIATGFAMFSMFFGAGNVVYPLEIGQLAQDKNFFAILGFLITGVGVPFMGLVAMTLFNGNYGHFFERMGKTPGFLMTFFIMAIIGPLGATPRTIALSYSTFSFYWPDISLPVFSLIACTVILLFTWKKSKIIDVLGYFLTPLLLLCLVTIIIGGLIFAPSFTSPNLSELQLFMTGLKEGYQTMDLIGAFFFSSIVMACLEKDRTPRDHKNYKEIIFLTLKASVIGATLLSVVYIGFSYVAAGYSAELASIAQDQHIGFLAFKILGPYAGLIAIGAVSLACLTTAIALVAVFAEFLHNDIFKDRLSYFPCLLTTIILTFFVSNLSFQGIMSFLIPILNVLYPVLILLVLINLGHKLYHWKSVKAPVAVAFIISFVMWWLN